MIQQLFDILGMEVITVVPRPFVGLADAPVIQSNAGIVISKATDLGVPGRRIAPYTA